jgi:hypothetical protein
MAAAFESRRLKLVVAVFSTLSVVLLVTSCFLYSAYSGAIQAARKAGLAERVALKQYDEAVKQYHGLRAKIGARAEAYDAVSLETSVQMKKVDQRLGALVEAVHSAVAKAQAAGAAGPELEEMKNQIQKLVSSFQSEPNKTYLSALDRFVGLMEQLSLMTTEMSLRYLDVRRALESAAVVAKVQVDVWRKAAADSHADVVVEHQRHDEERLTLLIKVDQLMADNTKQAVEIAELSARIRRHEPDATRQTAIQGGIDDQPKPGVPKTATGKTAAPKKDEKPLPEQDAPR